jgi:hypothetical protein
MIRFTRSFTMTHPILSTSALKSSFILGASMMVAMMSGAGAADLRIKKPAAVAPVSAACKETKALPADAFGFATGSDVADLGVWAGALDVAGVAGARGGDFMGISPVLQVSGSFLPCLEVGPFVNGFSSSFKPYGGGQKTDVTAFGGGLELKYKLLGRSTNGIGLTVAFTPSVAALDNSPGQSGTRYGGSLRLLADAELMQDKLYGALNLEYLSGLDTGTNLIARSSFLNVRLALTTKLSDSVYLGVEGSHQRAYTGSFLNKDAGNGWFVGPTFFWQATDKISVNGTWAMQVAGESTSPGRTLNIDTLNRHQARLKVAYTF